MRAIDVIDQQLVLTEQPTPEAGFGEVLIQVQAAGVNRADLSQAMGGYPPPSGASKILGLECSGSVTAVGDGVRSYQVGDEVCALLAGGGYAEYVNVPAGQVLPKPARLNMAEAAALPEVFATAYLNIYIEAAAQFGETVLVHSGASGVGTAAIQLCKTFGNPCFVTVGFDAKVRAVRKLGASVACNRRTEDFSEGVLAWTENAGVDVILDPVGAPYLEPNLHCLGMDGRLVVIGLMGGASAELPLGRMMMKRQRVIGSTLRARPIEAKAKIVEQLRHRVWPEIDTGAINAVVDCEIPLADAQQAHELLQTDRTIGKVVLTI